MELESTRSTIDINGETFDIIKNIRLLPGMVLRSRARGVYARVGLKQSTLEEQIHTVSLGERGFPVAKVIDSGPYGDTEWFFIETSLGDKTFHEQFSVEYETNGVVSDETFSRYLHILDFYTSAQYNPKNRTTISAKEFFEATAPDDQILSNYAVCGGDIKRYHEAVSQAIDKLTDCPMGLLQLDLNPFNVLDNGVIDFELVGYGPLGYDSSSISLWHRWFTSEQSRPYKISYRLSEDQISDAQSIVKKKAQIAGVIDPGEYREEFLLIKTAWSFTSTKKLLEEEPRSKRAFYLYRAALLTEAVNDYLEGLRIPVLDFPEIRSL